MPRRSLRKLSAVFAFAIALVILGRPVSPVSPVSAEAAEAAEAPLAHMVFFELKDKTDASRDALVAACQKYLSGHEGTVHFSVGVRGKEFDREVNDTRFDVALHLVFRDKAAHDKYQTHPRHLRFIEENKDAWAGVRVFDSYLAAE